MRHDPGVMRQMMELKVLREEGYLDGYDSDESLCIKHAMINAEREKRGAVMQTHKALTEMQQDNRTKNW